MLALNLRSKIFLLLGAVIAVFGGGLIWLKYMERRQFDLVAQNRLRERTESFDRVVQHWGEPLKTFTNHYSCWDEMVQAIKSGDRAGLDKNLSENVLNSFRTHVFWIYRADRSLFHSRNNLYSDSLLDVPVPRAAFPALLDGNKFCHFFAKTPIGYLEVRGATIHPSRDGQRLTASSGYLFAARLWSQEDLKEMSLFTGNQITLIGPEYPEPKADLRGSTVSFSRLIPGWDGKPMGRLVVSNESPVVEHFDQISDRLMLWLVAFGASILAILAIALRLWVWKPIECFSRCLRSENLALIAPLEKDRCEIGDLARLIHSFYQQRESLLDEMRERRQAEKALGESEEQLRHAQKMEAVGQLAGGVAHDFNNLLTAILGYAGLLKDRLRHDPQAVQDAQAIIKAGDQAAGLTRQLLAFSRKQVLHPKVIDLNELVRESEKLLRRVIGEHIELRVRAEAALGRVRADPVQIEQVIMNLAVNARDAMPRGGFLTIMTGDTLIPEATSQNGATLKGGRYVTLRVIDTGSGMDKDTQARIFEPFFTTKEAGKGTGLGLATVYGIVRQSGGAITVSSELGRGTTFLIHLPLENAPVDPPKTSTVTLEKSSKAETVLVVEDHTPVRELVCTVLRDNGYRVLSASDGAAALHVAQKHHGVIDLLISDVVMPRKSGPEVARELSAARPEMRVLFVSGYSDETAFDKEILSSDVEILEKPFTPGELTRKARELLNTKAITAS